MSPRSAAGRARHWPLWTLGLLGCHALLLAFLHARPGRAAMVPFMVARPVLLAAAGLLVALAAFDLLHEGWRRLLRVRLLFDLVALGAAVVLALFAYRTYPSSHDQTPASVCLALPFDAEIAVLEGGAALQGNAHAASPAQRYAYDLGVHELGSTHVADARALWDYFVYARPVLSPVGGVVVSIHDEEADRAPAAFEWRPWRSAAGNHVVIEVAHEQFLFLSRLQSGSIQVAVNDRVAPGTVIGRAGNSGRAGAPHLHMHMQDTPVFGGGEGIPIAFCEYETIDAGADWSSARRVTRGMPTGRGRPQIVRHPSRLE